MNVPKLRFKEFNDEWKKIQLDSFVDINPKNDSLPEQFIYIDLESVNNGILTTRKIINKSEAPSRAQRTIKENDILYQTVRPYQMNNLFVKNFDSDYPYIASTGYALLRTKENPYFVYSILYQKSFVNKVLDMCTGTSYPAISANDLGTITVGLPSLKEQEKISKTLELLDKKIELQSKKIEDLKLFTKNTISNELNNLQNYNIFKFKDICNIQTGKSNTQDKCDDGIYPFYIRSENIERSNNYIFDCEAVLTIGDGNIGKVFFYENGKFDCHQRVYVLNNFKNVLGKYVYYYFSSFFYKRAMSMSAKNTVDSVRMEMISDMIIKVPQEKEQIKIINLFSSLDKKLELEQNKLDKLQELKKGLMQNMFV